MPTFPDSGLTSAEAKRQLARFGPNLLPDPKSRSSLKILLHIVKEPMITLLIASGAIYFVLGDKVEAILLGSMIGFIALLTFVQEKKTENALTALKRLANPQVKVIRDGQEQIIASSLLVPQDFVKINEGDRVPADGQVVQTEELYVDESSLTGESLPVLKTKAQDIYSGTLVTSGWAVIKVKATGTKTKIGEIGVSLQTLTETPTRIQTETQGLIVKFAVLGIGLSLVAVAGLWLSSGNFAAAALQGIAIAMSLLPEEFPVVITIFMALGALRIARSRVLMTNLPTLETLGSATILCTDKTGTLTQNLMAVTAVISPNHLPEDPLQRKLSPGAKQTLSFARFACHQEISDSMEIAIDNAWKIIATHLPRIKEISSLKQNQTYMINQVNRESQKPVYVVKGALESILALCDLSPEERHQISAVATQFAAKGSRILAVASSNSPNDKYVYQGLICLSDPLRPGIKQAINDCFQAGIRVLMITGDFPDTARAIGQSIGLTGTDNLLTGKDIQTLSSTQLQRRLKATNICARIMPTQKLQIVEALKQNGEIVAMTGDGVNDAPALKAAHMGIAMGQKGNDVAREAADMILTDDNFVSIVKAIKGGRRIYTNIQKAVGFIIAVHIPIALIAIIPSLFGLPLVLTPVHIVILELLIDPSCTLVFEAEPADPAIMSEPPRHPQEKLFNRPIFTKAIISGLAISIAVFCAYLYDHRIAFLTLIYANLGLIFAYRANRGSFWRALVTKNRAFWIVTLAISLFMVGYVIFEHLSLAQLIQVFLFSLLSLGLLKYSHGFRWTKTIAG